MKLLSKFAPALLQPRKATIVCVVRKLEDGLCRMRLFCQWMGHKLELTLKAGNQFHYEVALQLANNQLSTHATRQGQSGICKMSEPRSHLM